MNFSDFDSVFTRSMCDQIRQQADQCLAILRDSAEQNPAGHFSIMTLVNNTETFEQFAALMKLQVGATSEAAWNLVKSHAFFAMMSAVASVHESRPDA